MCATTTTISLKVIRTITIIISITLIISIIAMPVTILILPQEPLVVTVILELVIAVLSGSSTLILSWELTCGA